MGDTAKQLASMFGISDTAGRNLASAGFATLESFRGVTAADLKAIDGIGDVSADRITAESKRFILEQEKTVLEKQNEDLAKENAKLKEVVEGVPSCLGAYPFGKNVRVCRVCNHHVQCKELSDKGAE